MTDGVGRREQFVMSDGFQLSYLRWRSTSALTAVILCIHGTGENSEFFEPIGKDLAGAGFEVYAIDLRGFGLSTEKSLVRGDTHSFKRQLRDLVEVITQIRQDSGRTIILIGHSHGCAYALWCSANHGELVNGIVLAAPPVESTAKVPKRQFVKFALLLLLAPRTMFSFGADGRLDPRIPEGSPVARSVSIRWLYGSKKLLLDPLVRNASETRTPVIILQGKQDTMTLPRGAEVLLEHIGAKDKTLQIFEGADHFLFDEFVPNRLSDDDAARGLFLKVLVDWLNRVAKAET